MLIKLGTAAELADDLAQETMLIVWRVCVGQNRAVACPSRLNGEGLKVMSLPAKMPSAFGSSFGERLAHPKLGGLGYAQSRLLRSDGDRRSL
jgi:hypothetical protein